MYSSIFKPVYLKGKAPCPECVQCQSAVPQKSAPTPTEIPPPNQNEGHPTLANNPDDDQEIHIPLLICRKGVTMVYPHEATRDVLTGKLPYYYADDSGCTRYEAKHIFSALRLNRKDRDKYGEYPLVGGHQRFLPKKERKRNFYRRSYIYEDYAKFYDVSKFGRSSKVF